MKTLVKISLCLLLLALIFVVFSACSYEGNVTIFADIFEYKKGVYKLSVDSDVESISFEKYISVAGNSVWKIYKDFDLSQEIVNKTVSLDKGENIFYVGVFNQNDSAVYAFEIYRRCLYEVCFYELKTIVLVGEGNLVSCPDVVPNKKGYEFVCWDFDFEKSITSDTVINALWQPKTYTIQLNAQGGEIENSLIFIDYDNPLVLPTPLKNGYLFEGWYCDEIKQQDGIWQNEQDAVFVANWEPIKYSINYNLDGGTNNPLNPSFFTIEDTVTLKPPTKTGYTFLGWTTEQQTVPALNVELIGDTGEKEFFAEWLTKSFTITLDCMGGECKLKTIEVTFDKKIELPSVTKKGYEFVGWFYNDGEICSDSIWSIDESVTLIAKWEIIIYKITYEVFGGENDISNPNTYTVEDETIILQSATKDKNIFCGWKQQDSYIISINNGSVGDIALSAHFESGTEGLQFIAYGTTYEVIDYVGQAKDVFVPESFKGLPVRTIKSNAFINAGHILTLIIPNSVEYIEEGAFSGCCSLKEMILPFIGCKVGNNYMQSSLFGWIFGNKYMGNCTPITSRYNDFYSYTFYMPDSLKKVTVTDETTIGYGAFENCVNITEICLNNEIYHINSYAFSGCSALKTLNISADSKIETIDNFAFKDCTAMTSLFLPDTLLNLSENAFENWTSSQTISLPYTSVPFSFSLCQAEIVYREELLNHI